MLQRILLVALFAGCNAAAQEEIPPGASWPLGDVGTPAGMIAAAAILRGSIPTIRILHKNEPS